MVPFYDEHGIRLARVLTDRGTEFCGTQSHEYELYLAVEDIDLDLRRFSGEALGHSAAIFSNCTGLVKSRAEWRRTGL